MWSNLSIVIFPASVVGVNLLSSPKNLCKYQPNLLLDMILHNNGNKTLASDNINYNHRLYDKQKMCTKKFGFCCSPWFVPLCFLSPGFSYEQKVTSCVEAYVQKTATVGLGPPTT